MNLILRVIFCCLFFSWAAWAEENSTFKCSGDDFYLTGLPMDRKRFEPVEVTPGTKTKMGKIECRAVVYWRTSDLPLTLNLSCYKNNYSKTHAWVDYLNWDDDVRYIIKNGRSHVNKEFTFDGQVKNITCHTFAKTKDSFDEYSIKVGFMRYTRKMCGLTPCKKQTGNGQQKSFRDDYTYFDSFKAFYKFHSEKRTWEQAKRLCELEGAILFIPENEREVTEVRAHYNQSDAAWFLGMNDFHTQGVFETIDGRSIDDVYNTWYVGKPDNWKGIENCVVLCDWNPICKLNDVPCTHKYAFACKKKDLAIKQEHDALGKAVNLHAYTSVVNSANGVETELKCFSLNGSNFIKWSSEYNQKFSIGIHSNYYYFPWTDFTGADGNNTSDVNQSTFHVMPWRNEFHGVFSCQDSYTKEYALIEVVSRPVIDRLQVEGRRLVWKVQSHQPLENITLTIWQLGVEEDQLMTYEVPLPDKKILTEYELEYELTDEKLAGNIYKARVMVKNRKEWSSPSYIFLFIGKQDSLSITTPKVVGIPGKPDSLSITTPKVVGVPDSSTSTSGIPKMETTTSMRLNQMYIIVGCSAGSVVIILVIIVYCIWKCKRNQQKPAEQIQENSVLFQNEYTCNPSDDLVYEYVAKDQVSHYEARALVTGNKKIGQEDFIPKIPLRPDEYVYDFTPREPPDFFKNENHYDYAVPSHLL